MKLAILDCHDQTYENIFKLCKKSKLKYCAIHNYEFIEFKFSNIKEYGPTWGRVFGIKENLKNFDYIFYLDTDILLTNFDFKISDIIDNDYEIIVGRMPDYVTGELNHISTSAILIKNSEWSFNFLNLWLKQTQFINKPYHAKKEHENLSTLGVGGLFYEQSAFHYLYDNQKEFREKIKIIEGINDRESTYKKNSFLIHFARSPKEKRIKNFLNKRIKL